MYFITVYINSQTNLGPLDKQTLNDCINKKCQAVTAWSKVSDVERMMPQKAQLRGSRPVHKTVALDGEL